MYQNNIQARPGQAIMPPAFSNPMLPYNNNAAIFYGNQQFAMSTIPPATYPIQAAPPVHEAHIRKKSIIENINPFIGENKNSPADILKSFPVSTFCR